MLKKELTVGIIILFLVSALTPMVIGNNNTETPEDETLNNIVFASATKNGSNADAYISRYIEQRSTQSDDEIIETIETSTQKPSPICNVKCFFSVKSILADMPVTLRKKCFLTGKRLP